MYTQEDEFDIHRFEDEGGTIVHMSDGHDVRVQDAANYIKHHPGVHPEQRQDVSQRNDTAGITRKLIQ